MEKPWRNLREYGKARLREATQEVEVSEKLLEMELPRNAAAKAFQACKSLLSTIASLHRDGLSRCFPGKVRVSRKLELERVDWVIAVMPTSLMKKAASCLEDYVHGITNIVSTALLLHDYQYNGPNREGLLNKYYDDETAINDIRLLINELRRLIQEIERAM